VEADLGQQNIGLASAWRKAAIRDDWRRIVDTAGVCHKRRKKKNNGFTHPFASGSQRTFAMIEINTVGRLKGRVELTY